MDDCIYRRGNSDVLEYIDHQNPVMAASAMKIIGLLYFFSGNLTFADINNAAAAN